MSPPLIQLAPMEGLLDPAIRDLLGRLGGFQLATTEFLRVTNQLYPQKVFTRIMPELANNCQTKSGIPVHLQLLGSDPIAMADNAAKAAELGAIGIDLNFGCPAKTVNKHGGGALLLKEPTKVYQIINQVRQAVPKEIPVTAKLRLGWDDPELIYETAPAAESAGANWLTIHARTRVDGYKHPARWEWLAKAKQQLNIDIVANGDIKTADDYFRCLEISECHSVMIGRGIVYNPGLALEIEQALQGKVSTGRLVDWPRILQMIDEYHQFLIEKGLGKHAVSRTKQWIRELAKHYIEADVLFEQIKKEKCSVTAGKFIQNAI
ncbi:tRNA dihydrouridine synthase [Pelagibaculum spongiae]|nr:tRNA-dihydrouridine synthase family protein [Pelagibaculum spongiae]